MQAPQSLTTLSWESLIAYDHLTTETSEKKVKWMGKYLQRCIESQPNSEMLIQAAGELFIRAEEERRNNIVEAFKVICKDQRVKTYSRQRFLLSARDGNSFQCISFWKLHGNDLFQSYDADNRSCAHLAALAGDVDTLIFFVSQESALQALVDKDRRTPLFLAVQEQHTDAVTLLLQKGSDRSHQDMFGMIPLHLAVDLGHFEIVKLLARRNDGEASESLNVRNKKGLRPVDLAERRFKEYPHIYNFLASFDHGN